MIKILHDNIESFRNTLYEDKRQMEDEIEKLNTDLEDLKTIWSGKDSDAFCSNMSDYLKKMRVIPLLLENVDEFVFNADKIFEQEDKEFMRDIKKEGIKFKKQV